MEKRTPLHNAVQYSNTEVVKLLIDNGAHVKAVDKGKWTPLHYAARFNPNAGMVSVLLDKGADLEARDDDQSTHLHKASGYNQ